MQGLLSQTTVGFNPNSILNYVKLFASLCLFL